MRKDMKKAVITGITGQDGSYLAELLLDKGYEVHGLIRRSSTFNTSRIDHLYVDPHDPDARLHLHYGDLRDGARLVTLLSQISPDEVYNLGAQSHVRVSFDEPEHTGDTTGMGRSGCWRRSGSQECSAGSIRRRVRRCSERHRPLRTRRHSSIRVHLMEPPRCTPTGSPRITARPTECSR